MFCTFFFTNSSSVCVCVCVGIADKTAAYFPSMNCSEDPSLLGCYTAQACEWKLRASRHIVTSWLPESSSAVLSKTSDLAMHIISFKFLHKLFCGWWERGLKKMWGGEQRVKMALIFVVPSIMLYSSEISPTRCNNCVFILRNGFTLHVSGENLAHHQEYICCIWPQVCRLT